MIIHNFHIMGVTLMPAETNTPLVVDTDAVLTPPVTFQTLQPIPRWRQQVAQILGFRQVTQFTPGGSLNVRRQPPGHLPKKDLLGLGASETQYHRLILTVIVNSVNRQD
jgi:hypothetical protein